MGKCTEPVFFLSIDTCTIYTSYTRVHYTYELYRAVSSLPVHIGKTMPVAANGGKNTDNYNIALGTLPNVRLHDLHHCSIPDTHKDDILQKLIIQECKKQIICSRIQAMTKNLRHLLLRVCRYTGCKNIYLPCDFCSIHRFFIPYHSQSITSSLWNERVMDLYWDLCRY